MTLRNENK